MFELGLEDKNDKVVFVPTIFRDMGARVLFASDLRPAPTPVNVQSYVACHCTRAWTTLINQRNSYWLALGPTRVDLCIFSACLFSLELPSSQAVA